MLSHDSFPSLLLSFLTPALLSPRFPPPLDASLSSSIPLSPLLPHPSPRQALSFRPILGARDCIVADQTGSGKTLAYLTPLMQRLREEEKERGREREGEGEMGAVAAKEGEDKLGLHSREGAQLGVVHATSKGAASSGSRQPGGQMRSSPLPATAEGRVRAVVLTPTAELAAQVRG